MDGNYVRNRITALRIQKCVSEYQMSYDLGHSKGYINNIFSGKVLPSMNELFAICEYFNISPQDFFNENAEDPQLKNKLLLGFEKLNKEDSILVLNIINRLTEEHS